MEMFTVKLNQRLPCITLASLFPKNFADRFFFLIFLLNSCGWRTETKENRRWRLEQWQRQRFTSIDTVKRNYEGGQDADGNCRQHIDQFVARSLGQTDIIDTRAYRTR